MPEATPNNGLSAGMAPGPNGGARVGPRPRGGPARSTRAQLHHAGPRMPLPITPVVKLVIAPGQAARIALHTAWGKSGAQLGR